MSILDANFDLDSGPRPSLRMTEEEFVEFAKDNPNAEWDDGEVVLKMAIEEAHDVLQSLIRTVMEWFISPKRLGRVYGPQFTTRLNLKRKTVRRDPDVMFVAAESLSRASSTVLNGPPEIAVEIVSPDSEFRDFHQKFSEYEEAGVREYWIVNPISKQAHLFVRNEKTNEFDRREPDAEGRLQSAVLPGLWFRPADLFAETPPSAKRLLNQIDPGLLSID
jgi:Uma2 family endonuclease